MAQPGWYKPTDYRMGIGYDIHPLIEGKKLFLGGIQIPYEKGLSGHSDADIVLHALMDALLGAAGLGDIGEHFPNTDKKYKDISSLKLLHQVREMIENRGLKVVNVDCVLLAEEPKISSYKIQMKEKIAQALNVDLNLRFSCFNLC